MRASICKKDPRHPIPSCLVTTLIVQFERLARMDSVSVFSQFNITIATQLRERQTLPSRQASPCVIVIVGMYGISNNYWASASRSALTFDNNVRRPLFPVLLDVQFLAISSKSRCSDRTIPLEPFFHSGYPTVQR